MDATYLKVRNSVSQVASMAMVVATGVTTDGNREILGCDIGDSESEGFWQSFLGSLSGASHLFSALRPEFGHPRRMQRIMPGQCTRPHFRAPTPGSQFTLNAISCTSPVLILPVPYPAMMAEE